MKDPAWFKAESDRLMDMVRAALWSGGAATYRGRLNGRDVIVLGYVQGPGSNPGSVNTTPLAILMTDDLYQMLQVDARKDGE